MPPSGPISAWEKALRVLSARACSEAELTSRLLRAGYPPDETAAAVRECAKRRYLDDALLAEDCAAMWRDRGHGTRSIRYKLRQRGIPDEIAATALAETVENEETAVLNAVNSKLPSLMRESDPRKRKAKALRFLAARGFSGDAIRTALKHINAAVAARNDGASNSTYSD